jgi:hypothetical protein
MRHADQYVGRRNQMKSTNAGLTGRRGPTGARGPWAAPTPGSNPEPRRQGSRALRDRPPDDGRHNAASARRAQRVAEASGLKRPREVPADGIVGVMWREGTWRCELGLVLGYPVLRLCDRDTVELEHEIMPGTIPEVAEVIRRAVLRHMSAHLAVRKTKTPLRED